MASYGNKALVKQLRVVVASFTDNKGNIVNEFNSYYIKRKLDGRRIDYLRNLVGLILNTNITGLETKIYLKNLNCTVKGVKVILDREYGIQSTENRIAAKIYYDKNKIIGAIGERALIDVIEFSNPDMDFYERLLIQAIDKYSCDKLLNKIDIKLPEPEGIVQCISDEDYNEFIDKIYVYTKKGKNEMSKNISSKATDYIRYLLSSDSLNEIDNKRRNEVIEMILG